MPFDKVRQSTTKGIQHIIQIYGVAVLVLVQYILLDYHQLASYTNQNNYINTTTNS